MLRRAGSPLRLTKDPRFASALGAGLDAEGAAIGVMGHCRLVTNGSRAIDGNNQPIVAGDLVGIHNGIVTNAEKLRRASGLDSQPSNEDESDTNTLFLRLERHLRASPGIEAALTDLYRELEGSASIAACWAGRQQLALATNTGSLFYLYSPRAGALAFASEKRILERYRARSRIFARLADADLLQLPAGQAFVTDFNLTRPSTFQLAAGVEHSLSTAPARVAKSPTIRILKADASTLKRCARCILPHTYPLISFDEAGVCNFCRRYKKQVFDGEAALERLLDKYRSKDGSPDCLVGLSGGRDSCYGIHLLKVKYGMTPIAFTFDWGLITDRSRRNQAKVCGKLGIEHIVRAPDIQRKRSHVRKNVLAFLKRPHLGMVPLFMAGDKEFYRLGRQLRHENNLKLTVMCMGQSLEQREFMTGFCGIDENIQDNKRLSEFSVWNKIKLATFYSGQYLRNPAYINASLVDSVRSFAHSFIGRDDALYLFQYLPWDESHIEKVLRDEYDWEADRNYGTNQWRMGDGQTAFTNYVYYSVAGFTEFDNFRANQIREGLLSRDEALRLIEQDNQPKWDALRFFSHAIGVNLDEVLCAVDNIPKLY